MGPSGRTRAVIDPHLDHVGIVVPDLDVAMEALSTNLGVTWAGVYSPKVPVRTGRRGLHDIPHRIAVTQQRPFLELIQAVPDSPWDLEGQSMVLHHIAYFVDDLGRDSAAIAGPCPIEIEGVGREGDVPRIFTYQVLDGLRFELLERRTGPLG
jgi:Glyoxalase/Bleomycin resistance protein/Dioxygenase superfamily